MHFFAGHLECLPDEPLRDSMTQFPEMNWKIGVQPMINVNQGRNVIG
jgi:hypothetical protein